MAIFANSINVVLQHEGGWVNNPNDPGGATKYGISLRFLEGHPEIGDFGMDGDVDISDIKNMTVEEAMQIYKEYWWDKFQYGNIADQNLATKTFDTSVNMGAKRAHIFLQKSINAVCGTTLEVDGVLGPATFTAINVVTDGSDYESKVLNMYCNEMWAYYQYLISKNPKLAEFTNGWKNRAFDLSFVK